MTLSMEGYFEEHVDFVTSVDASAVDKQSFLSASVDGRYAQLPYA